MHALEQYKSATGSSERSTRISMQWSQNAFGPFNFVGLRGTAGYNPGFDPTVFEHPGRDAPDDDVSRLADYIVDAIAAKIRARTLQIEDVDEKLITDEANVLIEDRFNPPVRDGLRMKLYNNFVGSPLGQVRARLESQFPDAVYVPVDAQSPPRHGLYPLVHGNESPARRSPPRPLRQETGVDFYRLGDGVAREPGRRLRGKVGPRHPQS